MKKLIIATRNEHKLREIKDILSGIPFKILSIPKWCPKVEEDGSTFEENAIKKAKSAFLCTKEISIADDSGLAVEYLNGAPGVYSSRFAPTDEERIQKLLKLLEGVPWDRRKARFICTVAIAFTEEKIEVVRGEVEGYITFSPQGKGGFGFDPVFYLPEYESTYSQLAHIKNTISHRAKAFLKAREVLQNYPKI